MDYNFLNQFHPRIIEVVRRDLLFWDENNYQMIRAQMRLHTLVLVTEGNGFLELDELSSPLQAGTIFQIVPGNQMIIHTKQEETLTFLSIHYNYGLVQWDGNAMQIVGSKACLPLERIIPLQEKTSLTEMWRMDKNYKSLRDTTLVEKAAFGIYQGAYSTDDAIINLFDISLAAFLPYF